MYAYPDLYSELCKISHEVDSIFGTQMTIKNGILFWFDSAKFYIQYLSTIISNLK